LRPSPMKCQTLLCVDDDRGMRELYQTLLGCYGYDAIVAADGEEALKLFRCKEKEIAAAIVDYQMPGMNGLELAAALKNHDPSLPVILISGCRLDPQEPLHFVDVALAKGLPVESIVERIEVLLEVRRTAQIVDPVAHIVSMSPHWLT